MSRSIHVRGRETGKLMTLEISDDNKQAQCRGSDKKGAVKDLALKVNGKECKIEQVTDETVIYTAKCSPGCSWIFWGGQWWYVC